MREWILQEVNYGYLKENPCEVAVLPMGATEPHNLHLPYGTDTFEATEIASRSCETAWKQGAKVIMLPAIPYGTETNQREFPLSMNVNPTTLGQIIKDLTASLEHQGIRKLLILNSHGGNDFKPLLREMYGTTKVNLFLCNWFKETSADVKADIFDHPDDHAGEMETSLGLAFFPELVSRNPEDGALHADDGACQQTRFEGINQGWISITRPWHLLTTNSGAGYPHAATAEKGHQLMEILVERISKFLVDLSNTEIDDKFPF